MSDTQTIQFELVSPERSLFSEPVELAIIPGEEGEFGVGANHSSLVASLKAGVVELYSEKGGAARKIFVAGGFADVNGEACTVLAEEAVNVDDLDQAAIEQQISDFNEDIGLADNEIEKARINRRLNLAKEKLSAITGTLVL